MGQRIVTKLYDVTSTAGGALDTGIIKVEQFDILLCYGVAAGAAAPANVPTIGIIADDGTQIDSIAMGIGVGGTGLLSLSSGGGIVAAAGSNAYAGPVPRRVKFFSTAGAASTVRMIIYGISIQ